MSTDNEEIRVKPQDDVEIRYTDLAKYNKSGSTTKVHRMHAEKLIASGKAELASGKKKKEETK